MKRMKPEEVFEIKKLLSYNPENGNLMWKKRVARHVREGDIAGCKDDKGYLLVGINGRSYKAHRLAWAIYYGSWPEKMIDHINHNTSDNRISNLRLCTNAENQWNAISRRGSSEYKGVTFHKRDKKWQAAIEHNKETLHLGYYDSEEEAARAYDAEAARLCGNFAHLNAEAPPEVAAWFHKIMEEESK